MNDRNQIELDPEDDDFAFATSESRAKSYDFDPRRDYGVRYILKGKEWYVKNNAEEWVPLGIEAVRRFLISSGLNPDKKGERTCQMWTLQFTT
jgi:hypothetical protein